MQLYYLLKSFRPKQWIKNFFIFAPAVFAVEIFNWDIFIKSLEAFFIFSLATGAVYTINDYLDIEKDKIHPKKKNRPFASGKLKPKFAFALLPLFLPVILFLAYKLNILFLYITIFYFFLNLAYSLCLKKIVILDVIVISIGFVLRVEIGGAVTGIDLSKWIIIVTYLLSMFLGFIKRRQEILRFMSENIDKNNTRLTLKYYNLPLLDQLIPITTSSTLLSYIVYVLDNDVAKRIGTDKLYLTIPFVVFGIFRYLYLVYTKELGESPEEVIFKDVSFLFNIILWISSFVLLMVFNA